MRTRPSNLLLIRHLESYKNTKRMFSSKEDNESLTERGKESGIQLAEGLKKFILKENLLIKYVHSAASKRAEATSSIIASHNNLIIKSYNNLGSIKSSNMGESEQAVINTNPDFMKGLNLYRMGLYNSYKIKRSNNHEPLLKFEKR